MKELVRCKSCGFIMEKGKLHDKCPACGVPSKMFEDYTENISPIRKLILSLDIHPVMVHFPQSFTFTLLVLIALSWIFQGGIRDSLLTTATVLEFCLPLVVLGAFLAGLLDGKTRFRRLTTPILVKKIVLGSVFFVFACAGLALVLLRTFQDPSTWMLVFALDLGCFGCSVWLAFLGTSILHAKFPG